MKGIIKQQLSIRYKLSNISFFIYICQVLKKSVKLCQNVQKTKKISHISDSVV